MKKEFNLSEKELTPHQFYEYQGGYTKEDVKEFIQKITMELAKEGMKAKELSLVFKVIRKLAGDKLSETKAQEFKRLLKQANIRF